MAIVELEQQKEGANTPIRAAIAEMRGALMAVGLFSFLISILMLTYPLYMMQLFDRVLSSMSVETLIMLSIITVAALITLGLLEAVRSRVMVRLSVKFDERIGRDVFNALFQANLRQKHGGMTLMQIDQIRAFITGQGLIAIFDAPFVPLFLLVLFLIHPVLGFVATAGSIIVVLLGLSMEWFWRKPMQKSAEDQTKAARFADNSLRNAEVVAALGMIGNLRRRWLKDHEAAIDSQATVVDAIGSITGAMKAASFLMPVIMLGTACYLVILEETTAGAMFAASVLTMRVIAPVQQLVTAYRGFSVTRDAFRNLNDLLMTVPDEKDLLRLPKPKGFVNVERVTAGPPNLKKPVLKNISFRLQPGQALGVIGPSGAGKSTLARLLVGVWQPYDGVVRLDAADVFQWDSEDLGPHIGYLPQEIDLFDGTIGENICRFGEPDDEKIMEAARKVGLHNAILKQAQGYDTEITGKSGILSGGQRQRLGLARALYGDPSLVVLDEPNSNLDGGGELSLAEAIKNMKDEGKTLIIIAHNPRALQHMDMILMLEDGRVKQFGPKDQVLSNVRVVSSRQLEEPPQAASDQAAKSDS